MGKRFQVIVLNQELVTHILSCMENITIEGRAASFHATAMQAVLNGMRVSEETVIKIQELVKESVGKSDVSGGDGASTTS